MTANRPLKAVSVAVFGENDEYYRVGFADVTAVEWHEQAGHMSMIPTIRVFINDKLHSEHPFHNILGVYYDEGQKQ